MGEKLKIGFVGSKLGKKYNALNCCSAFEHMRMLNDRFAVTHISAQKEFDSCYENVDAILFSGGNPKRRNIERQSSFLIWRPGEYKRLSYFCDPHHNDGLVEYLDSNNVTVLSKYLLPFIKYNKEFNGNFIWHPHFVADSFVNSDTLVFRGQKKIHLSGVIPKNKEFKELYTTRELLAGYSDIVYYENRCMTGKNYNSYNYKKGFIDYLGKFDASIAATNSESPYTVAKYFEILASGALLFAEYAPELDLLGFKHMVNCIIFTVDNFRELASDYLSSASDSKWLDIRRAGVDLVANNYTVSKSFDILEKLILGISDNSIFTEQFTITSASKRFMGG